MPKYDNADITDSQVSELGAAVPGSEYRQHGKTAGIATCDFLLLAMARLTTPRPARQLRVLGSPDSLLDSKNQEKAESGLPEAAL